MWPEDYGQIIRDRIERLERGEARIDDVLKTLRVLPDLIHSIDARLKVIENQEFERSVLQKWFIRLIEFVRWLVAIGVVSALLAMWDKIKVLTQ